MKRITFFLCAVFLTMIGFSQGSETFANLENATGDGNEMSSSYQTWTWTGDNGEEWTATDARTDQTINDKAITVRDGELSTTIPDGIGDLTLTTQRVFSGGEGDITVSVNGTEVGTIPYDDTEQTNTISGINVSGDATLLLETPGNGDRVAMDDLTWTEASGGGDDCAAVDVPFSQDFESVETPGLPDCGTLETIAGNDWQTKSLTSYGFDSNVLYYHYSTSESADTWYFTQGINLEAGVNYQISYKYGNRGSYPEKLKVALGTSAESSSMESELTDHTNILDVNSDAINFAVDNDGIYYFGFQAHSDTNENELYVDDIQIDIAPSCLRPTDLAVDNTTTDSADLSWMAGENETDWVVLYGAPGIDTDDPNTYETKDVNGSASTTLTGLESGTDYEFYVKADCGSGDTSVWEGPSSFSTDCDGIALDLPFTQDFEGVLPPNVPNCTTLETNNGDDWTTSEISNYGFDSQVLQHKYTGYLGGAVDAWFFTQGINLEAGVDYQISYRYGNNSSYSTEKLKVAYGLSAESSAMSNEIIDYDNISGSDSQIAEINFSVDQDGVYYFGFQAHSDENQNYLYLDDITIKVAPTCIHPTDLAIDNITTDQASIYWNAGDDETDWEVVVDTVDFDPNEGTPQASTDTTTTLTGLDANTAYDVYVRADCGEGDTSEWEGPITFMTNCDATDIPFTQDFEGVEPPVLPNCGSIETNVGAYNDDGWYTSHVTSYGFSSNVLKHDYSSSGSPDLDDWYFTQGINLEADVDYQITFQYGSNSTLEEKLKVAFGTSPESSAMTDPSNEIIDLTFEMQGSDNAEETFQVPVSGVYYFGFQIHSGDNKYYLYVDDIHIDVAPTCFHPTDFSVDNVTAEGADVYWMAQGNEDQWEVVVDTADFDPDEGTPETVTDTTTTLTGLDSETDYEVYVRADCGEGDTSVWEGPISFTTLPTCPAPTGIVFMNVASDSAQVAWNAGGNEEEWEVLYGESGFDPDSEGNAVNATDTITTLNNLEAETHYDVYVKALCTPDTDESDWTGPEDFVTSLESGYCLPGNNDSYYLSAFTTTGGMDNIDNTVDSPSPNGYADFTDQTVSQQLEDSFDFETTIGGTTLGAGLKIWIDWDQDGEFNSDDELVYQSTGYLGTHTGSIDVPVGASTGMTRMRVGLSYIPSNGPDGPCAQDSNFAFQDYGVEVISSNSCSAPTDITISNQSQSSADVSWTAGGDETQWEVLYGESGFDTDTEGQSLTVSASADTTLTDLEADTSYDVYVRTLCDDDEMSDWTGPESFTTENGQDYCTPTYTTGCTDGDRISNVSLNGESINLDNDSQCSANAYGDYTDLDQPDLNLGSTYTLSISTDYPTPIGEDARAWIDYNGNGTFEDSEEIASTNNLGFNPNGTNSFDFTVPGNVAPAEYRMRVRLVYNTSPIDPCANEDYGETEDYMVTITAEEPCDAPTAITVNADDITETSALVSWTETGTATQWEVLYGEEGFDTDTEGESLMVNTSADTTLTNLTADTSYEVYVRAVCSEDNVSDWTGPESFMTEMEPCEAPTDIIFSNNDNLSIDVSWTPAGSETQWEVLYGEAGFNPGDAGQSVTVNEDPQTTLEDLDPDTAYDVYVRAVCGEDNVSDWAGPANFLDVNRQVFESFTYYPNPVKGQLTLKANAPIESVTVFNLLGQEVISVNPNTLEAQVNTEDLQAAVYLMKVNINGSSKTFRIVKE